MVKDLKENCFNRLLLWLSRLNFLRDGSILKLILIGDYNLENALAAVCIGNYFGVEPLEITKCNRRISAFK